MYPRLTALVLFGLFSAAASADDKQPDQAQPADAKAGETVEAVQKKILELAPKLKSLTGKITINFDGRSEEDWIKGQTKGTIEYMVQEGKTLYRMELKSKTTTVSSKSESTKDESVTIICDGRYVYNVGVENGQKTAHKRRIDPVQSSIPSQEFFDVLNLAFVVKMLPDAEIDGQAVWAMQSNPRTAEPNPTPKTLSFFRKDIPFMVKTVNYDLNDNVIQATTISDVKINVSIKPERFAYTPDADTKVKDFTGEGAQTLVPIEAPE